MEESVRSALVALSSPGADPGAITRADNSLLNYEEQCADAYVLYLTSLSTSSPSSLRLSSILVLKAAVKRRWKDKGRGKPGQMRIFLDETTKAHVRSCLTSVSLTGRLPYGDVTAEQLDILRDYPLQTSVAALTATIARMDLPTRFHELIPTLVSGLSQTLESQEPTTMQEQVFHAIRLNILTTLESVLAEISTKRLLIDKKYRNSVAVAHLEQIYQCGLLPSLRHLDARLRALASDSRDQFDLVAMKYSMLSTQVVAYLLGSSFVKLTEGATSSLVDQVLLTIQSFIGQWLPAAIGQNTAAEAIDQLKELLKLQMELVIEIQTAHPIEFGRYLGGFLELFYTTLMSLLCDRAAILRNSEIAVVLLRFLSNVVGCGQYVDAQQVKHELEGVFTTESVRNLSTIMLHLFAIHSQVVETEEEVVYWEDDPEGFFHWEQQQSSDENVASAAQNCFLALAESPLYVDVVLPILLSTLSNVASLKTAVDVELRNGEQSVNGTDLLPLGSAPNWPIEDINSELIYQWDAVLTAAGLLASTLEGQNSFCFASWFRNVLSECLIKLLRCGVDQTKSQPVLLRRMIWLLSCNADHLDMKSPSPTAIELVASTFTSNQDLCLRLTSVQCLDALIPMFEDQPALLQLLAESKVPCLYKTLEDSDHPESRSLCLDLVANLVSYVGAVGGELSSSTLNIIVSPLRFIFDNSTGEHLLLRRNVLAILSSVATFVGREQVKLLYPLALPLLYHCLADQTNLFMEEESLRAWYVYLRLSSSYEPTLGDLFECCATRISLDLRHLP